MMKSKISYDTPYLDEEERETMEALDVAIDRGEISAPAKEEREAINDKWQGILKQSQQ